MSDERSLNVQKTSLSVVIHHADSAIIIQCDCMMIGRLEMLSGGTVIYFNQVECRASSVKLWLRLFVVWLKKYNVIINTKRKSERSGVGFYRKKFNNNIHTQHFICCVLTSYLQESLWC